MATSSPAKQPSDRSLAKDNKGGTRDTQRTREPLTRTSCLGGLVGGSTPVVQITDVQIYYGTMFGMAERYARALAHELATQRRLRVVVHDLDAFDDATFARQDRLGPARLFVVVVSTHFAGMPAPSAERFRDWINAAVANPRRVHECKPTAGSSRSLCTASMKSATAQDTGYWVFRRRKVPLQGMQYAVFGVGDSVYLTFNAMGKLVDLKLKKLGAVRFHPLGLGDCSNDIDGTFQQWQTALLAKLPMAASVDALAMARGAMAPNAVAPSPLGDQTEESLDDATGSTGPARDPPIRVLDNFGGAVVLEFRCRVLLDHEVDTSQLFTLYPSMASRCASSTSTLSSARVASFSAGPRTPRIALFDRAQFAEIEAVELCPGFGGESGSRRAATFCVHLLNPETTYISVSTLAIFPQNSLDYITRVAEAFAFDLDAVIELAPLPCDDDAELQQQRLLQLPFPTPCTVRTMLTEFLELRTVTREFVRAAAGFVVTSDERAMLEHLGSAEGSTAFRTQIVEPFKGILELIAMAPTLQIPLEVFVNITPPLKPRYFSIASSPKVTPHEVEIAVSMGVAGRSQGVCVSFLERVLSQPQGTRVPFRGFVSWSRFQFPDDGVSPMVFITMGVGLSAMRSIIQERLARWLETQRHGSHVGASSTRSGNRTIPATPPTLLLFLGATTKDHIVFRHDLNHWEQQMMVKVHYAFSNDPRHARRRVHEAVASRMEEIVDAMKSSNGSRLFACGRVTLVNRVRELFEADQVRRGSRWFDALVASGRFIDEGFI